MAEAVVERYYCHVCNVKFENALTDYTCPHCSKGFIEELECDADNPGEIRSSTDSDDYETLSNVPSDFLPVLPQEERESYTFGQMERPDSAHSNQETPFGNFIQEFIENLGATINWEGEDNIQVFLSNGDQEGLDAAVTQILNMIDSGPPPLSKDAIDALPIVQVTESQVSAKLKCSVCWEEFHLIEKVRQLPCQHVYHEPCIRPWLELHGTCPICRKNLEEENHQEP